MHRKAIIFIIMGLLVITGCQGPASQPLTPTSSPTDTLTAAPAEAKEQTIPTRTVTSLPALTLTPTAPRKLTPTSVPATPTPVEAEKYSFEKPFTLQYDFNGTIILTETETGRKREISGFEIRPRKGFLGWTRNSCAFYAWNENWDIVEVTLDGEVLQVMYSHKDADGAIPGYFRVQEELVIPNFQYVILHGYNGEILLDGPDRVFREQENIFIQDIKSGQISPVSQNDGAYTFDVSPDGTKIVYQDYENEDHLHLKIYMVNTDGSDKKMIPLPSVYDSLTASVKWSPDGKYIAVEKSYSSAIITVSDLSSRYVEGRFTRWTQDGLFGYRNMMDEWKWLDPETNEILSESDYPYALTEEQHRLEIEEIIPSLPTFPGEANCP